MLKAILVSLSLLIGAGPAIAATPAATISNILGEAFAVGVDGQRPLALGAILYPEDVIITGDDARLLITMTDGAQMRLGENAEFVLQSHQIDKEQGFAETLWEQINGAFRYQSGDGAVIARDNVKIRTPVATIGIRGTDFWGGPLDTTLEVFVFEGAVTFETDGGTALVTENRGVGVANASAAPWDVKSWSESKLERAVATIAFPGE